ncbi:MAG: ATP-binding protein [Nitrospiraceae bacterium]|nr:ATP-binding protein [Nitrospiraceae bacterium]
MSQKKNRKLVFAGCPVKLELLKNAFAARGYGFEIYCVETGAEGMKLLMEGDAAAAVVNCCLPDMESLDFVRESRPLYNHVPLIIVFGKADKEAMLDFLNEGASDCMAMDEGDFYESIVRVFERGAARSAYNKQTELAVMNAYSKWLAFFDDITDYIFMLDPGGRIVRSNLAFARAHGKHPKEIIGMDCSTLMGEELAGELRKFRRNGTHTEELRIGEETYQVSVFPHQREGEELVIYSMKNITEMKRLKDQLSHSDKLASIGLLVSGVAHEINNPLTGIITYTELLRMKAADETTKTILSKVMESAERCRKIIENLMTFSRQRALSKSFESINSIIDRTIELRSYWIRNGGIEIVREYAEVPTVLVDSQQIQQVILNVLLNAEQAIAEAGRKDGRIVFSTGYDNAGATVTIRISDNGGGISPHSMGKIFDPFFTTKPVGVGTGLGLSMSHGIISEHGGTISVESAENKGTAVVIEIPRKQSADILKEQKSMLDNLGS